MTDYVCFMPGSDLSDPTPHTFSFLLHRDRLPISPDGVNDSTFWFIVLLNKRYYLYAILRSARLEELLEGISAGWYAIVGNPVHSEYLFPLESADARYLATISSEPSAAVSGQVWVALCDAGDVIELQRISHAGDAVKFLPPSYETLSALSSIGLDTFTSDLHGLRLLNAGLRMTCYRSELWRQVHQPNEFDPFLGTAMSIVAKAQPSLEASLTSLVTSGEAIEGSGDRFGASELRALLPGSIVARNLLGTAAGTASRDFSSQLALSDRAEQRHQQILREVAQYAAQKGWQTLDSVEIDLLVCANGRRVLCEVKSSTAVNWREQLLRGVSQLLYYKWILSRDGLPPDACVLILEEQKESDSEAAMSFVLSTGCQLLPFLPKGIRGETMRMLDALLL